ncbi:MAG: PLP-dependent aminotransferase family protein [Deltaproteobacteria bacterium]|nr:PLP-dependent aminotransferase family protein [Deltaproteobacteria bacterium]
MWDYTFPKKDAKARYLYIADRLEEDIVSGELPPGCRLMPHRKLAEKVGVTVATIARAYGEAQQRGLVSKHVGRGTFVTEHGLLKPAVNNAQKNEFIELSIPMPLHSTELSVNPILQRILQTNSADFLVNHFNPMGLYKYREIGARWLSESGVDTNGDLVIIANGQQHALSSIVSALFEHGDRAAVAQFASPGLQMLMQRHGVVLEGIKMDEYGMLPDHLDTICQTQNIRGLFVTENTQNPNAHSLSIKRRQELCEVIARHNLPIIEDGTFTWMNNDKSHIFSALLPNLSVYYAGLGASFYSGLRVAFIHAPERFHTRISQAIMESTWTVASLNVAIACEAITDGTLTKSLKNKRKELESRVKVLQDTLAGFPVNRTKSSIYAWLFLPDSWQSKEFERQAERNGVRVSSADRFIVGEFTAPNCVRLSLTGPKDIPSLKRGLDILRRLLSKKGMLITPIW